LDRTFARRLDFGFHHDIEGVHNPRRPTEQDGRVDLRSDRPFLSARSPRKARARARWDVSLQALRA